MRRIALRWFVAASLLLCAAPALGEVFTLVNGGRVEGELLNPDDKPRQNYQVQIAGGARVTLEPSQVERVVSVGADEREYEKARHRYPDTPEGQWALAEWCREAGLLTQRDAHLERIIELDPNHVQARRALKYSQVDGQWQRKEDVMVGRGYVPYKGRWRTKQEIELMENRRKQEQAEKDWYQKVERWRAWLNTDRREAGRESILAINDAAAVKALAAALKRETRLDARIVFVEALWKLGAPEAVKPEPAPGERGADGPQSKVGSPEAVQTLAATAVEDSNEEVRLTCLDYLSKKPSAAVVSYFVGMLHSKNNAQVNHAAAGLGRMKDPSAVGPLIDALVTTHKFKIVTGSGGPNSISTTFGSGGSGGMPGGLSVGGGPKLVTQQIPNPRVLDALVNLTGQNFNFDKQAWKYWYATIKRPDVLEGRRGN